MALLSNGWHLVVNTVTTTSKCCTTVNIVIFKNESKATLCVGLSCRQMPILDFSFAFQQSFQCSISWVEVCLFVLLQVGAFPEHFLIPKKYCCSLSTKLRNVFFGMFSLIYCPEVHLWAHTMMVDEKAWLSVYSNSSHRCSIKSRLGLCRPVKFIRTKFAHPCLYGPCFVHWGTVMLTRWLPQTVSTKLKAKTWMKRVWCGWTWLARIEFWLFGDELAPRLRARPSNHFLWPGKCDSVTHSPKRYGKPQSSYGPTSD